MDPCTGLRFILVNSVAHIDRYSVANWQVKETLLSLSIQAHARASGRCIIVLNTVLLSVPFKGIGGHPRAISGVLGMVLRLVGDVRSVPFHSIVVKLGFTVVVVVDLADVDGVLHLVLGAA